LQGCGGAVSCLGREVGSELADVGLQREECSNCVVCFGGIR
jgi:hypothetical protein